MLGTQIEKLPVTVGNGSERIESSTEMLLPKDRVVTTDMVARRPTLIVKGPRTLSLPPMSSMSSVLKSSLVQFFLPFLAQPDHNQSKKFYKTMQPQPQLHATGCDRFLTKPVADCKKTSLDQVIQVSNFSFHTIYLLSADYWLVWSLYGTQSNLFLPALVNTVGMYYWYVLLVLCPCKCLYRFVY